ncbi:MAG: hypothetical protein ACREQE_09430 [Candidatus Binataceae bacterium]
MLDDFKRRARNRVETKIDSLTYLKVGNRLVTRGELIQVFQELAQIGCGAFIVGRKGRSTRFHWSIALTSVGRVAAGEEVPLEAISEEERELAKLPEEEVETYAFPLRPNLKVELELPIDLSFMEASRLADFIKTLPFDRKSSDQG